MVLSNAKIGQSYWKIMTDIHNAPLEIKEWVLVEINGSQKHCLYFNNAGDKEFAYAHHENSDWFLSYSEAADVMQDRLNRAIAFARSRVEHLEVIQHLFVEDQIVQAEKRMSKNP
jgi:hypothetical protein